MSQDKQPSSHWTWQSLQLGVFIFPVLPTWGAIILGLTLLGAAKSRYRQIVNIPLGWVLAGLSLWFLIISCFALNPLDSFLGAANFLPFFALFIVFSTIVRTTTQLHRLAWLLVIPSLVITILGLGQLFGNWTTSEALQSLLGWVLVAQGNPEGRMAAVFIYANILAAYLLIIFSLALGLWLISYQSWRRNPQQRQGLILLLLTIVLLGNAIALVLTNSRNAWGIALLVFIAFALYCGWRWLVWAIGALVTSILWASFGPNPGREWLRGIIPVYLWGRLSDELHPVRDVGTLRTSQWLFTLKMTQEKPLLGWGFRSFTPLYEQQANEWLGHPHNFYLMLMAETGLGATLILCGSIAWVMVQAVQFLTQQQEAHSKLIFFSYLVALSTIVLFNLLDVTSFDFRVNTLTWIILSAIYGVTRHRKQGTDSLNYEQNS